MMFPPPKGHGNVFKIWKDKLDGMIPKSLLLGWELHFIGYIYTKYAKDLYNATSKYYKVQWEQLDNVDKQGYAL